MRRLFICLAVVSTLGVPARADTLADVRSALSRLSRTQPVRARLQLSVRNQNEEQGSSEGRTTVRVAEGEEGLIITYPLAELDKAAAEQKAEKRNPESKTPTRMALREVDPVDAAEMLDYSSTLLTRLEGAQVIQEKAGAYAGKPARLLVLKLQPALSKAEGKRVKEMKYEMSLWVGNGGLPLAAETRLNVVAKFLLLTFRHKEKASWSYAHVANRLLVTEYSEDSSGSGLGQRFQRHRSAILTVN